MHIPRRLVALLFLAPALVAGALLSGGCSSGPSDGHITAGDSATEGSPAGRWFLSEAGHRLILDLRSEDGNARGDIAREGWPGQPIDRIVWAPDTGVLTFRTGGERHWRWYHGELVDGVFRGRATPPVDHSDTPPARTFTRHVTGWHAQRFNRDLVPRAWDLQLADGRLARVRIDQAAEPDDAGFVGTFKVFASLQHHSNAEELEYPLHHIAWDGDALHFQRDVDGRTDVFEGHADGRHLHGRYRTGADDGWRLWRGTRAEVLGYGLTPRSPADRDAWQIATRQQVKHLIMAGAPEPESHSVNVLRTDLPARASRTIDPGRDDKPDQWPAHYRMDELEFLYALPDAISGETIQRRSHAFLARPSAPAATPMPAVLVLNGHASGAWQMMDPDAWMYWYGDALARRGYLVLAMDVSHREYGDDPDGGNQAQPAIATDGMTSDWEEDGERVWNAIRAIDHLLSQPDVDPSRIAVFGLSLGAEVGIQAAALDPRIHLTVAASYLPDFQVMRWNANHECWWWLNADINEYVDLSTYLALIAPRRLIAQSAARDFTFSRRQPPISTDKQVARRARLAWNDRPDHVIHLLHPYEHSLRTGVASGGVQALSITEPGAPDDLGWQTDTTTVPLQQDLFELMLELQPRR